MKLLAPVSNWVMLRAAVETGCDEVYLGVKGFNMRATAKNFEVKDLGKVVDFCHKNNVKVNLTANVIIYENELKKLDTLLDKAKKAKIDAIICWDMAVIQLCKKKNIPFHISTQMSIANSVSADYFKKLGAERIVFARECSLNDLKKLKKLNIEIEAFGHGAMCVSLSGRCFLSQSAFGKSANRGECIQPCRRKYKITDVEGECEYELGEDYILSPKDLCTLPFLEKLYGVVDILKIEGRGRSPEYVKEVIEAYREAIDAIKNKKYDTKLKKKLMNKVKKVYNRGFGSGFYLGKPVNEWSKVYGSKATKKKKYIGVVKNFYKKHNVAEIKLEAGNLKLNDEIMIQGNKTGVFSQKVKSMQIDNKEVKKVDKGLNVGIKLNKTARMNDKVFLIE